MSWSIKLSGRPKLTSYFAIWILLQVAVVISEQPDGFLLPQSWHQRFGYNRDKGAGESQDLDDNSKFLRLYQKEASQVDQHRSHTSVNPLVVWGRRLNFPRSGDSDPDVSQVSRPEKYVDLFPSSDMNDKEISSARFNGDEEFGFDKLSVSQADLEKLENGKTSLEKLANLADRDAILRKQGSEESSWRKLASIVDKDPSLRKLGNTADIEENWRKIANLADKDSGLGYLGSSKAFSDDLDDSDLLLQNVAGKEPPHIHWPTDKVKSKMLLGMKSPDDDVTDINSVVIRGDFGEDIKGDINKTTEYLFEFFYNTSSLEKKAVRVTVSSPDSDYTNPLLVVVRQQRGVLSWQLPLEPPSNTIILEEYRTVSRTLCPVKNYKVSYGGALDSKQRLFIDISTSSPTNISFSVKVDFEEQFHIELHKEQTFEVTPSQPVFYEFLFPDEVDMILVKANAEDDFCAMVAIQNIT
ncbi:dsRNA-gated channel SID-1, partial [Halocaridina rubra]